MFCLFRVQSLQWAAHMVPLVHTEVPAHTALQDHQDPPGLPWVHTTPDHTTRDLQDHSKYSSSYLVTVIIYTGGCHSNHTVRSGASIHLILKFI